MYPTLDRQDVGENPCLPQAGKSPTYAEASVGRQNFQPEADPSPSSGVEPRAEKVKTSKEEKFTLKNLLLPSSQALHVLIIMAIYFMLTLFPETLNS